MRPIVARMQHGSLATDSPGAPSAVTLRGVTKRYGSRKALDGLDLTVPLSGIHALLGSHGSGKSTTLRVLTGLARAQSGHMTLLGQEVPQRLSLVMPRVGVVMGRPQFRPNVSVHRNLIILATAQGISHDRVDECLSVLDLLRQQDQAFRTLDTHSKQRVGIAAALLKSPELLILDEPVTSSDEVPGSPNLRACLSDLADSGITVLVSSHLLADVQGWADSASIISNGRLVAQGTLGELMQQRAHRVTVGVRDASRAARVLREHDFSVRNCGTSELMVTVLGSDAADMARITAVLAREGLYIHQMTSHSPSLEDTISSLTQSGAA